MKQNLKSIFGLLIVALMVPVKVAATIDFTVDGINYSKTSDWEVAVEAPAIGEYQGDIVIPASVTYDEHTYRVTEIGSNAIKGSGVTSITLPAGTIRTINYRGIFDCSSITSLTIPASVTYMDDEVLRFCDKLQDLYFCSAEPPSYLGSKVFDKINTSGNTCTLHVPRYHLAEYVVEPAFGVFTNKEEWDAPEIYGLKVAGCLVTEENKDDVLGDGSVTYVPGTKTLTIGADIITTVYDQEVLRNDSEDGLTVLFDNCSLTATSASVVFLSAETTLKGTVTLESSVTYAMNCWASIAIIDANIHFSGALYGYSGFDLEIKNSDLSGSVLYGAAILGFHDVLLTNCFYKQPTGAKYVNQELEDKNDNPSNSVTIKAGTPQSYNLWIAGTQVTELNCTDVLEDGAISYNPTTNTLTVGGSITAFLNEEHSRHAIDCMINGLIIRVIDNVTFMSDHGHTIKVTNDTRIEGTGTLTMMATEGYAIWQTDKNLTIANLTMMINYCNSGIGGNGGELRLQNTKIQGITNNAIIDDFENVLLTDCYYEEPVGAYYDNDDRMLKDIDGNVATSVKVVRGPAKVRYGLSFPREGYIACVEKAFTAPELSNELELDLPVVTYTSSNPAVATVNSSTGEVTINGKGMAVISATFAGDATYYAEKVYYYLMVGKWEGMPYDVNGDGKVSITDAVSVVNAILNGIK